MKIQSWSNQVGNCQYNSSNFRYCGAEQIARDMRFGRKHIYILEIVVPPWTSSLFSYASEPQASHVILPCYCVDLRLKKAKDRRDEISIHAGLFSSSNQFTLLPRLQLQFKMFWEDELKDELLILRPSWDGWLWREELLQRRHVNPAKNALFSQVNPRYSIQFNFADQLLFAVLTPSRGTFIETGRGQPTRILANATRFR